MSRQSEEVAPRGWCWGAWSASHQREGVDSHAELPPGWVVPSTGDRVSSPLALPSDFEADPPATSLPIQTPQPAAPILGKPW